MISCFYGIFKRYKMKANGLTIPNWLFASKNVDLQVAKKHQINKRQRNNHAVCLCPFCRDPYQPNLNKVNQPLNYKFSSFNIFTQYLSCGQVIQIMDSFNQWKWNWKKAPSHSQSVLLYVSKHLKGFKQGNQYNIWSMDLYVK